MQVGILQFFGWRDRSIPLNAVYASALERFEIMDRTGYGCVCLAEHHFSGFSCSPTRCCPESRDEVDARIEALASAARWAYHPRHQDDALDGMSQCRSG